MPHRGPDGPASCRSVAGFGAAGLPPGAPLAMMVRDAGHVFVVVRRICSCSAHGDQKDDGDVGDPGGDR